MPLPEQTTYATLLTIFFPTLIYLYRWVYPKAREHIEERREGALDQYERTKQLTIGEFLDLHKQLRKLNELEDHIDSCVTCTFWACVTINISSLAAIFLMSVEFYTSAIGLINIVLLLALPIFFIYFVDLLWRTRPFKTSKNCQQ